MTSSINWEKTGDVSFNSDSNACPDPTNRCVKTVTTDGDSHLTRTTIITGYLDIVFQIDLKVNSINSVNDEYCQISYNYDNNEYTVYNEYDQNGLYETEVIHFPPSYSSNIITIKLGVHGNSGDDKDRCYWDNAILRGNGAPTSEPTNDPTIFPTAHPTISLYLCMFIVR